MSGALLNWKYYLLWSEEHGSIVCISRVTRRPHLPRHVLFSRPKKCVRQGFQNRPRFCPVGYLCFSGSFTNYFLRPYKFWKGYIPYVPPSSTSSDCSENCHWSTGLSVLPDARYLSSHDDHFEHFIR